MRAGAWMKHSRYSSPAASTDAGNPTAFATCCCRARRAITAGSGRTCCSTRTPGPPSPTHSTSITSCCSAAITGCADTRCDTSPAPRAPCSRSKNATSVTGSRLPPVPRRCRVVRGRGTHLGPRRYWRDAARLAVRRRRWPAHRQHAQRSRQRAAHRHRGAARDPAWDRLCPAARRDPSQLLAGAHRDVRATVPADSRTDRNRGGTLPPPVHAWPACSTARSRRCRS